MSAMTKPRAISQSRNRVNIPMLFKVLRHIARNGGVAGPELREVTGLSRPTLSRLFADAEIALGVRVAWRWDMDMPSHGEYHIEDWGVLDSRRVMAFAEPRRRTKRKT